MCRIIVRVPHRMYCETVCASEMWNRSSQLLHTVVFGWILNSKSVSCGVQLYDEMGSRHRVRPPLLNIIKTATVPDSHCKRDNTKQFHQQYDDKINKQVRVKFPMTRKMVRSVTLLYGDFCRFHCFCQIHQSGRQLHVECPF